MAELSPHSSRATDNSFSHEKAPAGGKVPRNPAKIAFPVCLSCFVAPTPIFCPFIHDGQFPRPFSFCPPFFFNSRQFRGGKLYQSFGVGLRTPPRRAPLAGLEISPIEKKKAQLKNFPPFPGPPFFGCPGLFQHVHGRLAPTMALLCFFPFARTGNIVPIPHRPRSSSIPQHVRPGSKITRLVKNLRAQTTKLPEPPIRPFFPLYYNEANQFWAKYVNRFIFAPLPRKVQRNPFKRTVNGQANGFLLFFLHPHREAPFSHRINCFLKPKSTLWNAVAQRGC